MNKMTKTKSKLRAVLAARAASAQRSRAAAVAAAHSDLSAPAPPLSNDSALPRQRGRPTKASLRSKPTSKVSGGTNSTNSTCDIIKVLLRILKDQNKSMVTTNNGFARGLKPDAIVAGFQHEGELMLAVKFKNRKLPEVIRSAELKMRAPSLLIQYYISNLYYAHNE